jgi:hypothetical protein
MGLHKEARKEAPTYRKPNSPPVRRLGQGCLSGPSEPFVGPRYEDAHPPGTRRLTNEDLLKGCEKAMLVEARRFERDNPTELQGVRFKLTMSDSAREYRVQAAHKDACWSVISRTRAIKARLG